MQRKVFAWTLGVAAFLGLFQAGWGLRASHDAVIAGGENATNVGIVPWLYAREHEGMFPALDAASGRLAFREADVHPGYLVGEKLTGPLSDPETAIIYGYLDGYKAYTLRPLIDTRQYFYLGYAVASEAEGLAFLEALRAGAVDGAEDAAAPAGKGSFGTDRFHRLREDLSARLAEAGAVAGTPQELNARIPLIIERPGRYERPGAWVVYLDRHAEFLPYPGPFPMSEQFVKAMEATIPPDPAGP